MPDFHGVKEKDLESIIRRAVVLKFRARFFPKMYLDKCLPNHESYGIFARDPTLGDFLESGPGHAAACQTQSAWEADNGEQAARDCIDHFHRRGGDSARTCLDPLYLSCMCVVYKALVFLHAMHSLCQAIMGKPTRLCGNRAVYNPGWKQQLRSLGQPLSQSSWNQIAMRSGLSWLVKTQPLSPI